VKNLDDIIGERKADHIDVCLKENVQARNVTTGFEDVHLVHKALPEIDREQIKLSTSLFGYTFSAPIFIGAMTGGTEEAVRINAALAEAVEELNLGMGVGSQRIAVDNHQVERSFKIVREKAPTAFVLANIGGPQLVQNYGIKEVKRAVEMVQANALVIHLNALQEAVQSEGDTNYCGLIKKITEIVQQLDVPVIVKETGAGISCKDAIMLEDAGVSGIDVAGAGGTSWAAVEYYRAKTKRDSYSEQLGKIFWDWGIPTAASLVETIQSVKIPAIASGGIRDGLDISKALALGASLTNATYPFLQPAMKSSEEVKKMLRYLVGEMRNAMFLVGADSIENLQKVPIVLTGKTAEWLKVRGFQPDLYARRRT
jgi:isopentenyl-diphosphate delta-isomerase